MLNKEELAVVNGIGNEEFWHSNALFHKVFLQVLAGLVYLGPAVEQGNSVPCSGNIVTSI